MCLRRIFFLLPTLFSLGAFAADVGDLPVPPKGVALWSDLGRATPIAAFATANWANMENKPDVAVESVVFSDEDTAAFEVIFAALTANHRSTFKTVQRMAVMVMGSFARRSIPGKAPPTGYEILGEEEKVGGQVLLRYRFNNDPRIQTQLMKKFAGEWKLVVPSTGLNDKRRRDNFLKTAQEIGAALNP
jgi:hypothetical protein